MGKVRTEITRYVAGEITLDDLVAFLVAFDFKPSKTKSITKDPFAREFTLEESDFYGEDTYNEIPLAYARGDLTADDRDTIARALAEKNGTLDKYLAG